MADRYLLESGAPDGYLLEDGSGVLLLDQLQWSLVATSKNDAKYLNPPQVSPLVIPIPAGAQVGDVIDVLFQYGTPSTTDIAGLAATDDATTPNTYLQTGSTNYSSAHGQGMAAFRAVVADASAANITISWTANANGFIAGIAHLRRCAAGHITADPLTGTPNQANQATPGTGTDAINSGTTTPLVPGSLIVCYLMYPGSSPSSTTQGTSFALAIDDTTTAQQASEWLEQVSAAAIAGTWTEGSAQPAMTIVFAFAPPSGVTAKPGTAALSFAGLAPVVQQPRTVTPGVASVVFTGQAPKTPRVVLPGFAQIAFTGKAPVVLQPRTVVPGTASVLFTGKAPTVLQPRTVLPGLSQIVFTGKPPAVQTPVTAKPGLCSVVFTGKPPTALQPRTAKPGTGSVLFSGQPPTVKTPRTALPGLCQIVFTGQAPAVVAGSGKTVIPGTASLTFTGEAPAALQPRTAAPGKASLAFSGLAPVVRQPRTVLPGLGAVAFTGFAPTVTAPKVFRPGTASLVLAGLAPSAPQPRTVRPGSAQLLFQGIAPLVVIRVYAVMVADGGRAAYVVVESSAWPLELAQESRSSQLVAESSRQAPEFDEGGRAAAVLAQTGGG